MVPSASSFFFVFHSNKKSFTNPYSKVKATGAPDDMYSLSLYVILTSASFATGFISLRRMRFPGVVYSGKCFPRPSPSELEERLSSNQNSVSMISSAAPRL